MVARDERLAMTRCSHQAPETCDTWHELDAAHDNRAPAENVSEKVDVEQRSTQAYGRGAPACAAHRLY